MNTQVSDEYEDYVKPQVGQLLKLLRLDKIYDWGHHDQLRYQSKNGPQLVWDFLGGYGSTILGHNPDFLVDEANNFFKNKRVVQAQASVRSEAALLANELNKLFKEKINPNLDYICAFASTGSEATEIAIKNCMMRWNHLWENKNWENKLKNIQENDSKKLKIISVKGSYHGKTASAVLSSYNQHFRKMYRQGLFETVYLSGQESYHDLISILGSPLENNQVFAFIFEPIQGEGGIKLLNYNFLNDVFRWCRQAGAVTIADEIQSGFYRTGDFLACESLNLKPDIFLLGKSLGGGIAKISVAVISETVYHRELSWVHSSTFAEDDFSCLIARKCLKYLIKQESCIKSRANWFESEFFKFMADLKNQYPKWIKEARGKGFFLGVEFDFSEEKKMPAILHALAENGHASYLLTSYLLNKHNIRVGVTLSSPETIRIEPSAFITASAFESLKLALLGMLKILNENKFGEFLSTIFSNDSIIQKPSTLVTPAMTYDRRKIAFLSHVINLDHLKRLDKNLRSIDSERLQFFIKEYQEYNYPFRYHSQVIDAQTASAVDVSFYGIMVTSDLIEKEFKKNPFFLMNRINDWSNEMAKKGFQYIGLGQYTSIVTFNGLLIEGPRPCLTSGNSLTAATIIEKITKHCQVNNLNLHQLRVGIIGFGGNIGQAVTLWISKMTKDIVLVQRAESKNLEKNRLWIKTNLNEEKIVVTTQWSDVGTCDLVVVCVNSEDNQLKESDLKNGATVFDVSVPSAISDSLKASSNHSLVSCGLLKLPKQQIIQHDWLPLLSGQSFACLAETIICGLKGIDYDYSYGDLELEKVLTIMEWAKELGFEIV